MAKALWIVGEPGIGKTTLVHRLLGQPLAMVLKPKWTEFHGATWAAGHYSGSTFDGADTVPYNGAKEALDYVLLPERISKLNLVVFDGDRFSNLAAVERVGRRVAVPLCIHLVGSKGAERRAARGGGTQSTVWVKGRVTKSANFFEKFPLMAYDGPEGNEVLPNKLQLNGDRPTEELAAEVVKFFRLSFLPTSRLLAPALHQAGS